MTMGVLLLRSQFVSGEGGGAILLQGYPPHTPSAFPVLPVLPVLPVPVPFGKFSVLAAHFRLNSHTLTRLHWTNICSKGKNFSQVFVGSGNNTWNI